MRKRRIFISFLVVISLALCSIFLMGMAKEPEFDPEPIPYEEWTGNPADYPDSADSIGEEPILRIDELTTVAANAP